MVPSSKWTTFLARVFGITLTTTRHKLRRLARPRVESLENRITPTVDLSIASPVPFAEGDSGTTNLIFMVTRTGDSAALTVDFATQDGTAFAGTDYTKSTGTVSFAYGQTTASIAVPIIGNTLLQSDRTFTVSLSNPLESASFTVQQTFSTGAFPSTVAVGDFNGDGRPDLVSANRYSNTVSVLFNTTAPGATNPGFSGEQTFPTGNNPGSIAVGDFNGDGRPDLSVVNSGTEASPDSTVSVLLNTTAPGAAIPSFATQLAFTTGSRPISVAADDLNGDGKPDLTVANLNSSSVSVLFNTTVPGATAPSFSNQQTFSTGAKPISVAVGDINNDGLPDLMVANNIASGSVSLLRNSTAPGSALPSFATQQTFVTGNNPQSIAVSDLNGDGLADLAVANNGSNTVSVLFNTTTPGATTSSFAAQQSIASGNNPVSVAVSDFNGDGKPDLVVANQSSASTSVLLNMTSPGAATPRFAARQTFAAGNLPASVMVSDFNGDGLPDIAVANANSNTLSVHLNARSPITMAASFTNQQTFFTGDTPRSVAVGDFNGDGKPDLAIANYTSMVSVMFNTTAIGTGLRMRCSFS